MRRPWSKSSSRHRRWDCQSISSHDHRLRPRVPTAQARDVISTKNIQLAGGFSEYPGRVLDRLQPIGPSPARGLAHSRAAVRRHRPKDYGPEDTVSDSNSPRLSTPVPLSLRCGRSTTLKNGLLQRIAPLAQEKVWGPWLSTCVASVQTPGPQAREIQRPAPEGV